MSTEETTADQTDRDGIIVGVDGSPGSDHALRWAIANAERFGPVQPVATWRYPWWMVPDRLPGAPKPPPSQQFQEETMARVDGMLDSVGWEHCRKPIVSESAAGPALVTLGLKANLIVVGTRGRGATADALLGSVSTHVASHGTVPVVIVPEQAPIEDAPGRVVVGVDGSSNSIAALTWAIETTPDDVTLEAVHAWSYTVTSLPESGHMPTDIFELQARQTLDHSVVEATLAAGGTRHEIVHRLEYGDPRKVLRDLSEDAGLLVLGARGQQGIVNLLLGSTTAGLTHQPPTTTVVVPSMTEPKRA